MRRKLHKDAMNILNVSIQHSILTLAANGWSRRRIARELGINRETVSRHLRLAQSKPAIPLTGEGAEPEAKPAISLTGSEVTGVNHSIGHFRHWLVETMTID